MTKKQNKVEEQKAKKFYFSKEDMDNFKTKDSVVEYIQGIVHQDQLLYVQVVVLPRLGLPESTPFRIVDTEGKIAMETGKPWIAIEVPANTTRMKVSNEQIAGTGKEEKK
jgi:hypothetical protein